MKCENCNRYDLYTLSTISGETYCIQCVRNNPDLRERIKKQDKESREMLCRIKAKKLFKNAGMNHRYQNARYDGFKYRQNQISASNQIADYISGKKTGIFLSGKPGTGKTHISHVLANHDIQDNKKVSYVSSCSMTKDFGGIKSQKMEYLESSQVVVIDDLGQENSSDAFKSLLFQIVNYVYNRNMSLIVSSNIMSIDSLVDRYGEAVSRRIVALCGKPTII